MQRLLLLAAALACTSGSGTSTGGGSAPAPAGERTLAVDDASVYKTTDQETSTFTVAAAPEQVLAALVSAYSELGVQATLLDRNAGQVGNGNLVATRQLGKTPLASYFDCGTSLTGLKADTHRLTISVLSVARSSGAGKTEVMTRVRAQGRDVVGGNSSDPVYCGTKGVLEEHLRRLVQRALER